MGPPDPQLRARPVADQGLAHRRGKGRHANGARWRPGRFHQREPEAGSVGVEEDNKLIEERREKLKALRSQGVAFPNDFRPRDRMGDLSAKHGALDKPTLEAQTIAVSVAGRMMLKRVMGKASFATLQDGSGRLQVYVSNDVAGADAHEQFKHWDLGDIVGVEGTLFRTNKGELTVNATVLGLLVKALRPLPEKFHGLAD